MRSTATCDVHRRTRAPRRRVQFWRRASALRGLGHLSSAAPGRGALVGAAKTITRTALELRPSAAPDLSSKLSRRLRARSTRRSGDLGARLHGGARSPEHPLVPRRRSRVDRRAAERRRCLLARALSACAPIFRLCALAGSRIPIVADAARAPGAWRGSSRPRETCLQNKLRSDVTQDVLRPTQRSRERDRRPRRS